MKSSSVDLIITDPPYNVQYNDKINFLNEIHHGTLKHVIEGSKKWDEETVNLHELSKQMYRVLKNDSHLYIWCSEKQIADIAPSFEKSGFTFHQILVWVKNRPSMDMTFGLKYAYKHEICLFFHKGSRKLNIKRKLRNTILKYDIMGEQQEYIHPTQKPIAMFRDLIFNSTDEDDLVLDLFMGSGTSALASKQIKRNFIGFELSKHYWKISSERVNEYKNLDSFDGFK